jgi:class 3 adenylate cyclase/tetratricopeptide (TPR) repeat protein
VSPPGARFCDNCGRPLERSCPGCGTLNRPGARFCNQCGSTLADPPEAAPAPPEGALIQETPATPEPAALHEGERKHATVLFADVRGSTALIEALDAEQAIAALDPAVQAMVRAVEQFGGVVNRRMGDGIMALFGAPVATEDHALRACLAARAMVDGVAELQDPDIAIRVGLSSGDVVIRSTGNDANDYDAMGVTVHLAARMEQIAEPGTVLLTAPTARLAQGMLQLLPLGPIELKGISHPVPAFRLLGASEHPSWEIRSAASSLSPFIGREAELTQLGLALRRARLRRGQAVWVSADAGVGKSRLMHEFLRMLPPGTWSVLRVAATPQTTGVPYHLTVQLLRALVGATPAETTAEVAGKLLDALARSPDGAIIDTVPLLALLDQPVEASDPAGWASQDQAARRRRLLVAVRQVVLRAAGLEPLILLVDDFHWVDQPSIAVLDEIVAAMGTARLLVLLTTRPERRPGWRSEAGGGDVVAIQLQPLAPGNADALLQDLLGAADTLAPLRARIVAQADGTPLFLEEIARSLLESGVIAAHGGDAPDLAAAHLTEVTIPASVQAILAARMDRLPPVRRRLLQIASVVGKDVPSALLAAIADLPAAQLATELAELRAAGFLYEVALPTGIEHTFKHALTHAVAYDSLLRRHRRDLHARVHAAMLALYGDREEELTEQLAGHALRGEVWADAVRHALAAGDRANHRSGWQEAVAFLEHAVAALDHLPRDQHTIALGIEARLKLRVVLAPLADVPRMMRYLDEAGALAQQAGDQLMLARVNISRGAMLAHMGDIRGALSVSRMALDTMLAADDSVGVVGAAFALSQAMWYAGEFAAGAAVLEENLPHVRNERRLQGTMITTGTASAIYLCSLSSIHVRTGNLAAAAEAAREARAIAEATRRPFDLLAVAIYEGPLYLELGNIDAAIDVLEAAMDIARTSDILVHIPFIARSLGRAYTRAGRLDEAETLLDSASDYATRHGLGGMRLLCGPPLALLRVQRDDPRALATCQATLEAARATGMRAVEAQALGTLGLYHARQPRPEASGGESEAETWLRRSVALADQLGMRPTALAVRTALADHLRNTGRLPEAAPLDDECAALRAAMGYDGSVSYPMPPPRSAPRDAVGSA